MPVTKYVTQEQFESLKRRVKKLEEVTETTSFITNFNWEGFGERERKILYSLADDPKGLTTSELAKVLGLNQPEGSGRVLVLRKIKAIIRYSKRIKGAPLVVRIGRHWQLNQDEFSFAISTPIAESL